MNDFAYTAASVRAALQPRAAALEEEMVWLAGSTPDVRERARAALPRRRVAAAVLVPLVERGAGLNVLLTQRAANLRDHGGQIGFPGGRIEPQDSGAWQAALREAREEVGLAPQSVDFAGYLPDHLIVTGYRVTPVVGFLNPDYQMRIDSSEVHEAFEVPLDFLFNAANHRPRLRRIGDVDVTFYDIPYGERNIWGATAAMLMTLRRLVLERAGRTE